MKNSLVLFVILSSMVNIFTQSSTISIFDSAKDDYKRGQYSFAVSGFNRYIKLSNDNDKIPEAHFYLGLSHYFLKNYPLALYNLNSIQRVNNLSPYKALSFFWKGLIYQNSGNFAAAESEFNNFITLLPNSDLIPRALFASANSRVEQDNLDGALTALETLLSKYPTSERFEDAVILRSYILIKKNKLIEAKKFLLKTHANIKSDRILSYLGEICFELGDYDESMDFYKTIERDFSSSKLLDIALLRLSQIERMKGNYPEATEYILRLNNEFPQTLYSLEAAVDLALIEFAKNNITDSLVLFNQVLKTTNQRLLQKGMPKPERDKLSEIKNYSTLYIAEINLKRNDTNAAINSLNEVLRSGYFKENALLKLLEVYITNKEYVKASELASKHSQSFNENNYFNFYRARLEYEKADYKQAIKLLELVTIDDDNREAIISLKTALYTIAGDPKKALELLRQTTNETPIQYKARYINRIMKVALGLKDYSTINSYYDEFQTMIKFNPVDTRLVLQLDTDFIAALSFMQQLRFKESQGLLQSIIAYRDNKSLTNLSETFNLSNFYLGWVLYKQMDYINASRYFTLAANSDIDLSIKEESSFMDGYSYFSSGDYRIARDKFIRITTSTKNPDIIVKATFYAAKCSDNLSDRTTSVKYYNQIFNNYPKSEYADDTLFELIKISIEKKDSVSLADKISTFETTYKESPLLLNAIVTIADFYYKNNQFSEAFSYYTKYILLLSDPTDPDQDFAYYFTADSAIKNTDFTSASDYSSRLISTFQESPYLENTLLIKIKAAAATGDFNGEIEAIKKIEVKYSDKYTKTFERRKMALELISKGTPEADAVRQVTFNLGTEQEKLAVIKFYLNSGDTGTGLKLADKLYNTSKSQFAAEALLLTANIKLSIDEKVSAEALYLKLITEYAGAELVMAEALYKLAFIYHSNGKTQPAIKLLDTIISRYRETEWGARAVSLKERVQN